MKAISRRIPKSIKKPLAVIRQMLVYTSYDSSEYWRRRASSPGQAAVLWKNQEYNALYRIDQRRIIEPWVQSLPSGATVLDIGCGVGVVASMLRSIRSDIAIDGVDFEEMIAIARDQTQGQDIRYIASSAEEYKGDGQGYDLIISSGCYSAIRNIDKLKKSLDNGALMLKAGGILLFIDPFHRWNYLARAKFATRDVVAHLRHFNFKLVKKSGVLFWPFRVRLANSDLSGTELETQYRRGEWLLSRLGQHFWADYKILIFRKPS